jgi:hypothetical protein
MFVSFREIIKHLSLYFLLMYAVEIGRRIDEMKIQFPFSLK